LLEVDDERGGKEASDEGRSEIEVEVEVSFFDSDQGEVFQLI